MSLNGCIHIILILQRSLEIETDGGISRTYYPRIVSDAWIMASLFCIKVGPYSIMFMGKVVGFFLKLLLWHTMYLKNPNEINI